MATFCVQYCPIIGLSYQEVACSIFHQPGSDIAALSSACRDLLVPRSCTVTWACRALPWINWTIFWWTFLLEILTASQENSRVVILSFSRMAPLRGVGQPHSPYDIWEFLRDFWFYAIKTPNWSKRIGTVSMYVQNIHVELQRSLFRWPWRYRSRSISPPNASCLPRCFCHSFVLWCTCVNADPEHDCFHCRPYQPTAAQF